jgi:hypothetical protein
MFLYDMKSQILAEATYSLYVGGISDKEREPGESCEGFARCPGSLAFGIVVQIFEF